MDNPTLVQLLCLGLPIILMISALLLLIGFFIIRSIIRSYRRKAGLPKGTGKILQNQIKSLNQRLANDERQTAQWERERQPLDISNEANSSPIPDFSYESDPISPEQHKPMPQNCPACGAPIIPDSQACGFCGTKI